MENRGISVIICCYNSGKIISTTLKYLSKQVHLEDILWEIIVVNNNSIDNTVSVAIRSIEELGLKDIAKIVNEKRPGLTYARKKGIHEAKYDLLLFCDDDNWLDSHYVKTGFDILESNAMIGVLGGRGIPECEVSPPYWFEQYKDNYATGPQGKVSGDITNDKGYAYGAGSFYRKSVLVYLFNEGFVSLLEDRKGNSLSSGGDTELCNAIKLAGYRIWYSDELVFRHFIPSERLAWQYIKNLHKGYLKGYSAITSYRYAQVKAPFIKLWLLDIKRKISDIVLLMIRLPSYYINNLGYKHRVSLRFKIFALCNIVFYAPKINKQLDQIKTSSWYRG